MNNIPTAESLLEETLGEELSLRGCSALLAKDLMIAFAKLHVQAALEAAHSNSQMPQEDLDFTLQSYPLTNIK